MVSRHTSISSKTGMVVISSFSASFLPLNPLKLAYWLRQGRNNPYREACMSTRFSLLKNSAFLADKLILQTFLSIISSRSRISICDVFMKLAKKDLVNFLLKVNHFPPTPTEQLHRGGICLLQNAAANQKNIQSRPYLPLCSFPLSALSLG